MTVWPHDTTKITLLACSMVGLRLITYVFLHSRIYIASLKGNYSEVNDMSDGWTSYEIDFFLSSVQPMSWGHNTPTMVHCWGVVPSAKNPLVLYPWKLLLIVIGYLLTMSLTYQLRRVMVATSAMHQLWIYCLHYTTIIAFSVKRKMLVQ